MAIATMFKTYFKLKSDPFAKTYCKTLVEVPPQKRLYRIANLYKFGSNSDIFYLQFPYIQFALIESSSGESTFFSTASFKSIDLSNIHYPANTHYEASPLPLLNVNSLGKVCLGTTYGNFIDCVDQFWSGIGNQEITSCVRTHSRLLGSETYAMMGEAPGYQYCVNFFREWEVNGPPKTIEQFKIKKKLIGTDEDYEYQEITNPEEIDPVMKFYELNRNERKKILDATELGSTKLDAFRFRKDKLIKLLNEKNILHKS